MCVMAKNQNHRGCSEASGQRRAVDFCAVGSSGLVLGNKKPAGLVAVAVHVAPNVASIRAAGKSRVVAIPAAGFGQAAGGTPIKTSAAHITKPSTGRGVTSGPASPGSFCGRAG